MRRVSLRLSLSAILVTAIACGAGSDRGTGKDAGADAGPAVSFLDPGRAELHRLNTNEYNATVGDVLGTAAAPADGTWSGGEAAGFDNIASVLHVDANQYQRYWNAARDLAAEVAGSAERRARFATCSLDDAACVTSSLRAAGLRLFRRPLDADELGTYQRVFDAARGLGDDGPASFALALQAMLSSAEFLYRIERDAKPDAPEVHLLTPYELATRLSYFLWSSAPDAALLAASADGTLAKPQTLDATVDRLLDDPRSSRFVESFAGQWLGARDVLSHPVAPNYYKWSRPVAEAASQEMLLYFTDFLTSGRPWQEFPTADLNFVDAATGYLYGMPPTVAPDVGVYTRVESFADHRKGFFGLLGFLAVSSFDRRTSPSHRGLAIAGQLLCAEPPPPPPNIPKLETDDPSGGMPAATFDVRKKLEAHRAMPACAGCHSLVDSYGLALESFDGMGLWRATYDDGSPIDTSVTLPGGQNVTGLEGLADAVAADPRLGACLARKLFTYALGRTLTDADEPQLTRALASWTSGGATPSLRRLIHVVVQSDAFRTRRGGA